ncbi:MAG: hypothetical protein LBQ12_13535 [Deltaproteobacteria bacterium]|nr:hypothetical protein [Deltaproteobacteria bacterium]
MKRIKKISVQSPERKLGSVRHGNEGPVKARTSCNKHGWGSILYAEPDIGTGTATTMTNPMKRRFEFQDFTDSLCEPNPCMKVPDS